jgi:hypothetical protein
MQTIKEKKLLVKFAKSMGQPIDPALVEEVRQYDEMQKAIQESVKAASSELFVTEEKTKEEVPVVVEEPRTEPAPELNLVERAVKAIKPAIVEADSFQQPSVNVPADLKAVKDKVKFLEQWIGKISVTGPGGGAGDVSTLSHQTVSVTSNSYTMGRRDYYVGVNHAGKVTIYLPASPPPGRKVTVKDESGNCGAGINRWITIRTNDGLDIDGKNAANLAINWGSLTFVNRNGWRII